MFNLDSGLLGVGVGVGLYSVCVCGLMIIFGTTFLKALTVVGPTVNALFVNWKIDERRSVQSLEYARE